jgi:uncharacterized protein (TIGR03000 family)
MKTLRKCLVLSALGALLVPATAHAQFRFFGGSSPNGFGSPYGFGSAYGYGWPYGFGSANGYGWPYGYSMSPYGYGTQYGGYPYYGGTYSTGQQSFYSGAYVQPVVYSVSTASIAASSPPRMRPVAYPAVPYRATPAATPVQETQARIDVRVPTESAEVWFEGVRMTQTGMERHFVTPALEPGFVYTMEIRAHWNDANGKQQSRTERIDVRAGASQAVDFQTVP